MKSDSDLIDIESARKPYGFAPNSFNDYGDFARLQRAVKPRVIFRFT
jgi:hypothetical protein